MPTGKRPDITPAQIVAVVIAGIPIIASLLASFHVYSVTPEQQDALSSAVTWGGVVAALFVGGDVALRSARNHADAKVHAAALSAGTVPPVGPDPGVLSEDLETQDELDLDPSWTRVAEQDIEQGVGEGRENPAPEVPAHPRHGHERSAGRLAVDDPQT